MGITNCAFPKSMSHVSRSDALCVSVNGRKTAGTACEQASMALRRVSPAGLISCSPVGLRCEEVLKKGVLYRRGGMISANATGLHSTMVAHGRGSAIQCLCVEVSPSSLARKGVRLAAANGDLLHVAGVTTKGKVEAALSDLVLDGSKTTAIAHKVWESVVRAGDTVIDATCGNGHDTLMLSKLVLQEEPSGHVIGLDLQQSALDNTASLLDRELNLSQRENVKLLLLCHSQLDKVVIESPVRLVAFNLGYQPGGDKSFITQANTTVEALSAAVSIVQQQGLISIMSYVGHPGGREEYLAVREFVAGLPSNEWVCSHLEWINRPLCPHLIFMLRQ